eukprot:6104647-Pyramimonas_sp.AAC.1
MMMSFSIYIELQMRHTAVRHSNRKEIIRRTNLKYLDAPNRAEHESVDANRAVDELQLFGTAIGRKSSDAQVSNI